MFIPSKFFSMLREARMEQKTKKKSLDGAWIRSRPKLGFFWLHFSFSRHQKKLRWGKKNVELGLGSKFGATPKVDIFFLQSKLLLMPKKTQIEQKNIWGWVRAWLLFLLQLSFFHHWKKLGCSKKKGVGLLFFATIELLSMMN